MAAHRPARTQNRAPTAATPNDQLRSLAEDLLTSRTMPTTMRTATHHTQQIHTTHNTVTQHTQYFQQ